MKKIIGCIFCSIAILGCVSVCHAMGGSGYISFGGGLAGKSATLENEEKSYISSKAIVKAVQDVLSEEGIECGAADGVAGDKTILAIKEYQDRNDMIVTGEIDDKLLEKMGIDSEGNRIVESKKDVIFKLQKQIEELESQIALLEQENKQLKTKIEESEPDVKNTLEHASKSDEHYCDVEGCYNIASETMRGFLDELYYYCAEHYGEMMNFIGKMEEDVGKGGSSKHTCEATGCEKEGTHSIIGILGTTEYYCTEHHNELKEMISLLIE